jgi:hypothetical protein
LDAARAIAAIVERAAKRRYLDGQVAFIDRHARPNSIHNLVFGDDLAVPLKEEIQDFRSA